MRVLISSRGDSFKVGGIDSPLFSFGVSNSVFLESLRVHHRLEVKINSWFRVISLPFWIDRASNKLRNRSKPDSFRNVSRVHGVNWRGESSYQWDQRRREASARSVELSRRVYTYTWYIDTYIEIDTAWRFQRRVNKKKVVFIEYGDCVIIAGRPEIYDKPACARDTGDTITYEPGSCGIRWTFLNLVRSTYSLPRIGRGESRYW